jgi:3-hydroxyacyl-CoA dehydrogenase
VVLATSSSGILVSEIQRVCVHPQRVLVGHPINPPHVIPLVEVIGGAGASQTSIDVAMAFYRGTGKRPILVRKEVKGHIVNRLQAALWQEAIHLVATDAATVAEVDAAIAHAAGLRWAVAGPFVNLHLSGGAGGITRVLETLGPAIESWWRDLGSVSLTPQLIAKIAAGVAAELGSIDAATLARERDAAVIRIIAAVNLRDDTPPT